MALVLGQMTRATWKIGTKKNCDMTKALLIKELENSDIYDVNRYKIDDLKAKVKSFVLKNDFLSFKQIIEKIKKYMLHLQY